MCGRYAQGRALVEIALRFGLEPGEYGQYIPRFNIAPTESAPVIITQEGKRQLRFMHWGYIPPWSKEPKTKFSTINARAESLTTSKLYAPALKTCRAIVPVTGFYEWTGPKGKKQPYFIYLKDGEPFGLAGLWSCWKSRADDTVIHSYTVITTEANDLVRPLHDRMPVILHREDEAAWLDPAVDDPNRLTGMLRPYESDAMALHAVSTAVNKAGYDVPELCEQAELW